MTRAQFIPMVPIGQGVSAAALVWHLTMAHNNFHSIRTADDLSAQVLIPGVGHHLVFGYDLSHAATTTAAA